MLRARKGFSVRGGIKHIGSLAAIVVIVQIIRERHVMGRMPAAEKPTFLLGMRTGAVESCAVEKYLHSLMGTEDRRKSYHFQCNTC